MGCHLSFCRCDSTAPSAKSDESASTWYCKHWSFCNYSPQGVEGGLLFSSPFPFFFPCQLVEWFCDLTVVLDEPSVEVTEPKETLEFFQLLWHCSVCQGLSLDGVHLDSPFRYYHSQVLDFFLLYFAFFGFDVEFVGSEDL